MLTILLCGLWGIVWIIMATNRKSTVYTIRVDEYGRMTTLDVHGQPVAPRVPPQRPHAENPRALIRPIGSEPVSPVRLVIGVTLTAAIFVAVIILM